MSSERSGVFPPPSPGPPYLKSAHSGDGIWQAFFQGAGEPGKKSRQTRELPEDFGMDLVRRMVIHPHEASRFQKLTVAAFDLSRLRLGHRPGVQDLKDMKMDRLLDQGGTVPQAERASLFAVFNGGFQPRHGRWGMLSIGTQIVPPREDGCTVAILSDDEVLIAPWPHVEQGKSSPVAYRQTPPCLIQGGVLHPLLQKGERGPWAGQNEELKTRRRSAVGLSEDGRTLFFGVGEETEAEVLAAGMRHAGAFSSAQLDINWNWTRLFLFDASDGSAASVGSLEVDMAKDRGEYLERAGARGFFYLNRRSD